LGVCASAFSAIARKSDYMAKADRVGPLPHPGPGIMFERENIRWCELALRALAERRG
jgi:hypothetical protein